MFVSEIETEIAELSRRYGAPRRVAVELSGRPFNPLTKSDRYGEVCMVVRRPNGKLLTAIKTFYPAGAFRLLTGGIAHGEPIGAALLREVEEETGLEVAIRKFLAVVEYTLIPRQGDTETSGDQGSSASGLPVSVSPAPRFATFAFLLDELGGTLEVRDESERIGAFREIDVAELPALAETLDRVPDTSDDEVEGSWQDWGRFRAVIHRVVYDVLTSFPD